MRVKLKRNFYAGNAKLYRSADGEQDIPDELCRHLPKDAEIIDPKDKVKYAAWVKEDAKAAGQPKVPDKTETEVDLEDMNYTQLKAYAVANHLDFKGAKSKEEALVAIKAGKKDKSAEVNAILGQ